MKLLRQLACTSSALIRQKQFHKLVHKGKDVQIVTSGLVEGLLKQGLLREEPGQGLLKLSKAGRLALRRHLSAGGHEVADGRKSITVPFPEGQKDAAAQKARLNLMESPLAWLARRRDRKGKALLNAEQVKAGEQLRADYDFARLMPSFAGGWRMEAISTSTHPGGAGVEMSDDVLAARKRVEKMLASLEPALAGLLIDVCCHLKGLETVESERGWPARSAKVVLQIALQSLAERYGYYTVAEGKAGQLRSFGRTVSVKRTAL